MEYDIEKEIFQEIEKILQIHLLSAQRKKKKRRMPEKGRFLRASVFADMQTHVTCVTIDELSGWRFDHA